VITARRPSRRPLPRYVCSPKSGACRISASSPGCSSCSAGQLLGVLAGRVLDGVLILAHGACAYPGARRIGEMPVTEPTRHGPHRISTGVARLPQAGRRGPRRRSVAGRPGGRPPVVPS
jgi:hypothetical protein